MLALAREFERESGLSMAISANLVRVLEQTASKLADLPRWSGVSKEAIHMALGLLQKKGLVVIETAGRAKLIRLTAKVLRARQQYFELIGTVERQWEERFGKDLLHPLRAELEALVGDATAEASPLFSGLEPYPEGWRARAPRPRTLPHFPMVLHRGGFQDGS